MTSCDYLLIGGGVASYNAAKRIQRLMPSARTMMVTRDSLPPYDLPPLSKEFLRGEKTEADLVYPAIDVGGSGSFELIKRVSVAAVDADMQRVRLTDGRAIAYGTLLLATGADPIQLNVPGADLDGVYYLRSAEDSVRISRAAATSKRAVVIGAGFIGLEIAASLARLGLEVTIVEAMNRVWPRFADNVIADQVRAACERCGIRFSIGEGVVELLGNTKATTVVTTSGARIGCDLVCVGIGVRPNIELARAAGIEVDDGIVVDSHMRTNLQGIFAAGDVVRFVDPITGKRTRAEHWGNAEYTGQLAGNNMCGKSETYDFINYAWTDVFDIHIDSVGHMGDFDEVLIRGDIATNTFTSLYLKNKALVAFCAMNRPPVEFTTYRKMIRTKQDLTSRIDGLRNSSVNVRTLVQQ